VSRLSIIEREGTNAACSREIHLLIRGFIRFARTLEMVFYNTLQRDIIDSGLSHLGARTICVAFKSNGKTPFASQEVAVVKMSPLMSFQNRWKKAGFRPSGPGDLSGCILKTASLNSCSVKGCVRMLLSSSKTRG